MRSGATTKSGLNLDVLLVCRQIYREASLLPFEKNTFVFGLHDPVEGRYETMGGFVDRLKDEQREAIRHVVVASDDALCVFERSDVELLDGVRSLHMLLAARDDGSDFHMILEDCRIFAAEDPMDWKPLKTFRITTEADLDKRTLGALSSQVPELDRIVRGMEAKFLRLNSEPADPKIALPKPEDVETEDGAIEGDDDDEKTYRRLQKLGNEFYAMLKS
jgi:hypothetical protein